ncbi:MAG: DUF411 domain-containing protein [Rhodoferax sp.]|nr:DUF411 domain-containing protein [Rhodoferax sp.]
MQRRSIIQATAALLGAASLASPLIGLTQTRAQVEVWKTATCGCCHDWVAHLEASGFQVKTHDISDMAKTAQRRQLGLADKFASCHTALVGGYVLEGHVPARDIRRLLKERPNALGLAVPGMPIGSPGMDGPAYGGRKDPYGVLLVQRDGSSSVYQSY